MSYSQTDIDSAMAFAKRVKIKASINSQDRQTVDFSRSEEIPKDLEGEVKDLLEIAVQYYQRSIWTGEYLMQDEDPPVRPSGDPLEDINFYLSYYKNKLIEELQKAYELDEGLKPKVNKPKISPFAEQMILHRKEMMQKAKESNKTKEDKKKES